MRFKCCCLFLLLSITERTTSVESSGQKNNKGSKLNVNNTKNNGHNIFGITEEINENNNSEISYTRIFDASDAYQENFLDYLDLDNQLYQYRNLSKVLSKQADLESGCIVYHFVLEVKESNWEKLLLVAEKYKWELLLFNAISTSNGTDQKIIARFNFHPPIASYGDIDLTWDYPAFVQWKVPDLPRIYHSSKTLRICGSVPFCDYFANFACMNTSIKICDQCSVVNGSLFVIGLLILGLIILLSNILIVTVYYRRHQKKKLSKSDIIKLSLAIADLFTGNKDLFYK